MAEKNETKPAEGQAQPMQPQVVVHAQYVKDFSFENPKAPQSLLETASEQPKIDVNIGVAADPIDEKERRFEVVLTINATAKQKDEKLFIAELAYAAVITIGKELEEQHIHPLVMIEGPRMLFPFARQALANITQSGGFMPLNLQPIDFVRIYQAGIEQQRAQQAAANGGGGDAKPAAAADAGKDDKKDKKK